MRADEITQDFRVILRECSTDLPGLLWPEWQPSFNRLLKKPDSPILFQNRDVISD
jgi:hypothetical protein